MGCIRRWIVGMLALCAHAQVFAPPADPANLGTLEGKVIDAATNAPIPGASVRYVRTTGSGHDETASDAGGEFHFRNVPPGDYSFYVLAKGYATLSALGSRQPRRDGLALTLTAGQNLSGIVLRLTPFAAIAGRITDLDGNPLAGIEVAPWRLTYFSGQKGLRAENQWFTTDKNGAYRLSNLAPGRYYLSATDETPVKPPDEERYVRRYYPGTLDPEAAAPIDLTPGVETSIGMKLSKVPTVHVRGQVLSAAAANVTLSPDGFLFNSARVTKSAPPDGRFEFDGVLPGVYRLRISLSDGERETGASRLLLVGAGGVEGLSISLVPNASVTGRIRIDGDADRVDLSKFAIHLWQVDSGAGLTYGTAVDKDGYFKVEDVRPGRYRVRCPQAPAGFYLKTVRSGNQELPGRVLDLNISAPVQIEVTMSPKAASVSGTVSLPDSDKPIAEATVVVIPRERERRDDVFAYLKTTSDASGRFAIGGVPPGDYRVFAWETVDTFNNVYMDPAFILPLEGRGIPVSLAESDHADIKVNLISAQ